MSGDGPTERIDSWRQRTISHGALIREIERSTRRDTRRTPVPGAAARLASEVLARQPSGKKSAVSKGYEVQDITVAAALASACPQPVSLRVLGRWRLRCPVPMQSLTDAPSPADALASVASIEEGTPSNVLVLPPSVEREMNGNEESLGVQGRPFNRKSPFFIGLTGAFGVAVAYVLVRGVADITTVLVIIGLALFIAIGLNPILEFLVGRGLKRGIAVALVVFGFVLVIAGFALAAVPPLSHEVHDPRMNSEVDAVPPRWRLGTAAGLSFSIFFGIWLALAGTTDPEDVVAGAVAAAISVGIGAYVSRGGRALPSFRHGDLLRFGKLIPQLFRETGLVYLATIRRVRGRGGPSGFRTVATDAVGPGWPGARRSAVIGAILSATPRSVLIELDSTTGVAKVHDLVSHDGRSG